MSTSPNLKSMVFSVSAILTLFIAIAVAQQSSTASSSSEGVLLAMKGRNLSSEQVTELERLVEQNPDDLKSQTLLLGYYFSNRAGDKSLYKKSEEAILRLIRSHPEAAVLGTPYGQLLPVVQNYAEGERLWKEQLQNHPNDRRIIYNAGHSFLSGQNLDLAISTFKQGKSVDPYNSVAWDRDLGNAYKLKVIRVGDPSLTKEALNSLESAYAAGSKMERSSLLPDLGKTALAAGELDKAVAYANEMLATDDNGWNKGNLIYYGNYVLGIVAIKNGDLESAAKYLLQAGDTPGSPQLNSFGPNMTLAKELLDRGQKDTVLAFLKKCSKFWTSPLGPCNKWIQQMEEGQTPDFRMNLSY